MSVLSRIQRPPILFVCGVDALHAVALSAWLRGSRVLWLHRALAPEHRGADTVSAWAARWRLMIAADPAIVCTCLPHIRWLPSIAADVTDRVQLADACELVTGLTDLSQLLAGSV